MFLRVSACAALLLIIALPFTAVADSTHPSSSKRISLDLQNASIHSALRIIAEVSDLNIVVHPEVHGEITLHLKNVPWDQALRLILRSKGLYQVREGNVMIVAPLDKVPQLYFSGTGL